MEVLVELLKDASIYTVKKIVKMAEEDPEVIGNLVKLTFLNKGSVSLRAVWTLTHCHESMPESLKPYIVQLIEATPDFAHAGMRRSALKILSAETIPEDYQVFMFDYCLQWLISKKEPIAVKAYAMDILTNISMQEPDLKNEVALAILDIMPHGSKGIQAKGRKVLKKLGVEIDEI
jgi:hypothetical protein